MSTSRKEILELLAKGKISAVEAAELLSEMSADKVTDPVAEKVTPPSPPDPIKAVANPVIKPVGNGAKPAWLHVRVKDLQSGRNKVTVNVPLGMVKFGLKIGGRFSPELNGLDWDEIQGLMNEVESGMLVDVQDEEGGEHVQVFID